MFTGSLVLTRAEVADGGVYKCRAESRLTTTFYSRDYRLVVSEL